MQIIKPLYHLCRHCGCGRLLKVADDEGCIFIWCPNCELSADDHLKMCFCGHRFPSGARSYLKCIKDTEAIPPHNVVIVLDQEAVKDYNNKINTATQPKERRSETQSTY